MKKAIILGGGVTGCVSARELGKKGYRVTLIEKNLFRRRMSYIFYGRSSLYRGTEIFDYHR